MVSEREIDSFIENHMNEMLSDLASLVEIESVQSAPEAGSPYGREVRRALDRALEIAGRLGLETCDGGGYVGFARLPGRQDTAGCLASISHVDVVPAGPGWHFDPFHMTVKDGWLIGRGTDDDKNAAVITLYAAKFLKEHGGLNHELRILLGCNEETGMHDIPHYVESYGEPAFCLVPDVFFPACNGEKGMYAASLQSCALSGNLIDIKGGEAANAVPGSASAKIRTAGLLPPGEHITIHAGNGMAELTAAGRGGHASEPEKTENAIGILVKYLLKNKLLSVREEKFFSLLGKVFADCHGEALGIAAKDEIFGPLTCAGGTIRMADGKVTQTIDIRYPLTARGENIDAALRRLAGESDAVLTVDKSSAPFYVSPDSLPLQACLRACNEVTGRSEKAEVIGGTTYARMFQHAIGFGMDDMSEKAPEFVGMLHGPDEGFSIRQFKTALKIYIRAFLELDRLTYQSSCLHQVQYFH